MRPRRLAYAAALALLTIASLVGAAAAGSAVPASARIDPVAAPAGVDFGSPPARRLAPLRPAYIQEQLGIAPTVRPGASSPAAADLAKNYRCVDGRQIDDPLAPPCNSTPVTANAGPTYQGVTAEEIRVAVVAYGNYTYPCGGRDRGCTGQNSTAPHDVWFDLDKPQSRDLMFARAMQDYGRFFNSRFQTFGRRVHLYLYFFDSGKYYDAEASKAQAKKVVDALHPFAVILQTPQFSEVMAAELARRGVPTFTDLWSPAQKTAYYAQYPNRLWGYWPAIEQSADSFAGYVCTKVAPNPVSMSGIAGHNGRPRKIGMIHGLYHDSVENKQAADAVRARLTACGVQLADEGEFVNGNGCHTADLRHTPVADLKIMTRFKLAGVTTVLWPTCVSGSISVAATAIDYHPEWIVLGDYGFDANGPVSDAGLGTLFDGHAVVVTPATVEPPLHDKRCYQAMHEVDRAISDFDAWWSCRTYGQFRQLFSAIQLAGPSLGPGSMGRGLHGLPVVNSTDPLTPTCSYAANDTACVKDAMAMYWDDQAPTEYNGKSPTGCWRVLEGGRRYLPSAWPAGNVDAQKRGDERCNNHDNDFDGGIVLPDRYHVTAGIPPLPETLP